MHFLLLAPRVLTMFQPWAEISERLRRICLRIQTDALLHLLFAGFAARFELASLQCGRMVTDPHRVQLPGSRRFSES